VSEPAADTETRGVFDPHVIAKIDRLQLRARSVVEGFMLGVHRSPYHGVSTDFAEHRHYVQGDDLRHLDWKVYARSDRFYVKRYEQDTNLEAHFLVDASRSMFFRSDETAMSKFDYAATLTASLAYLLQKQRDAAGLTLFDSTLRTTLPPRANRAHFRLLCETLEAATPGADTALGPVVRKLGLAVKRRGLVVIASDFLGETDDLGEALALHAVEGNEVVLFRVEDPEERTFPWRGPSVLVGSEGEGRLLCDPRDLRYEYLAGRERHLVRLLDACRRHGFMLEEAPTDAPLDNLLSAFLNMRATLFRR
jgi:uncharacterized protein (DUF58 family)